MQTKWSARHNLLRVGIGKAFLMLLAIIVFAFPAGAAQKDKPAKGPQPVGAVNSGNGGVYEKDKYGIILKHINFTQDQLYDGNDELDFIRPQKGQKPGKKCYERTTEKYQLTLRAGISENLDARLIIPYLGKEMKRQSFNNDFTDSDSGIGDIKLISRYRIWSQKKKDPFNLAFGLGVKMPTGKTDEEDDSGVCLPGYLQAGSGSWDPIFELGAHKIIGRHWISTYFRYKMATKGELGDRDFEKPDIFKYNVAYAYALSNLFDLELELNGEVRGKAELDGKKNDNSGGQIIYLTPGIHFKFYKGMHCDVGMPIPVYRDLNGPQLSEDYRIITKLAIKF